MHKRPGFDWPRRDREDLQIIPGNPHSARCVPTTGTNPLNSEAVIASKGCMLLLDLSQIKPRLLWLRSYLPASPVRLQHESFYRAKIHERGFRRVFGMSTMASAFPARASGLNLSAEARRGARLRFCGF